MNDLTAWLAQRGLAKYAPVFADNDVDLDVFKTLSEDDLRELGLPLGARKRILQAIADANEPVVAPARDVEAEPTPGPERRQITVLFCDVVGSTALSEQVDAEDLRVLILAYQQACAAAIAEYDGHIAQYLGDGVLVYFGYPHAHEDDAVRAVRAGLSMIERMKDVNRRLVAEHGVALEIRVGVHTGPVVAGEMGGARCRVLRSHRADRGVAVSCRGTPESTYGAELPGPPEPRAALERGEVRRTSGDGGFAAVTEAPA
jgi:class 3 adenylate cyclase